MIKQMMPDFEYLATKGWEKNVSTQLGVHKVGF
jgi:hypothetical protein